MSAPNKSLLNRLRDIHPLRAEPLAVPPARRGVRPRSHNDLVVFIVAGEHSGDVLGAALMRELASRRKSQVRFLGVGGEAMEAAGLSSLFPLGEIAVMGPIAILKALPRLTRRVYQTVAAGIAAAPDIIVIIDSPEFTHRVARRLHRKLPDVPIIDYVCPSVWAWRPGRAKTMARFIDHVLTLLPFEPDALARLGGPAATYVGHPLSERLQWLREIETEEWRARLGLRQGRWPLVVLPGSRRSEIERLMLVFGDAVRRLADQGRDCDLLIPCVPHLRARIDELSVDWPMRRYLIDGDDAKFAAFRLARAALAASGTVTLELGVSGTPMVVAYKVDAIAASLRFLLKVDSVVLANLVLDERAFPEFLQEDCTSEALASAIGDLLDDTPARAAQVRALDRLGVRMQQGLKAPSAIAADVVLDHVHDDAEAGVA